MALTSDNKVYWIIKMPLVFFREIKECRLECPMQNTIEKSPRLTFLQVYYCIHSHVMCLSMWLCVCLLTTCISDACKGQEKKKRVRLRFPKVEIIDCCDLSWVWDLRLASLQKQQLLFSEQQFLQPHCSHF